MRTNIECLIAMQNLLTSRAFGWLGDGFQTGGFMKSNSIRWYAGFLVAVFSAALAITPGISSAQKGKAMEIHMCAVLAEADVAPIVGAHQISQETKGGTSCMWGDPGSNSDKPRLLIQAPDFARGPSADPSRNETTTEERIASSFKVNRKQAFDDKTSRAKNEPQLGRDAFSALTDDGVEILIMKKNTLLNIQYLTGKRGTEDNVDAIRKAAAKVAAAF
jgi:hypothetical protein